MNENPSQGNHLHGGYVALLLGLVFGFCLYYNPILIPHQKIYLQTTLSRQMV